MQVIILDVHKEGKVVIATATTPEESVFMLRSPSMIRFITHIKPIKDLQKIDNIRLADLIDIAENRAKGYFGSTFKVNQFVLFGK